VPERLRDVSVATIRAALPQPIVFGDWAMRHREFALVRLRAESGAEGFAFTLTREGPVAASVRQAIAHQYVAETIADRLSIARLFARCRRSNLACLSSGVGLRALSLVDLAAHDLAARSAGLSIPRWLGGAPQPMPATAIVGYPPATMDADAVRAQVAGLRTAGWRRFKIPIALPLERGRARLLAAREAAGDDAWLGMDAAWVFDEVDEAAAFLGSVESARLDWYEDVFPPGDAAIVAALRGRANGTHVAMGDEQGGSYFPDALLAASAVDAVRVDVTCMGGISGLERILEPCRRAEIAFAPHMFAHVHSQIFGGLGHDVPIEWGVPGTGVDQYADSLPQPEIREGLMEPLPDEPGFGTLVNREWLAAQELVDDGDGLVSSLLR
jgi:L-alanine-DL-glutamate epimerase-like enolase superfamily enzyme